MQQDEQLSKGSNNLKNSLEDFNDWLYELQDDWDITNAEMKMVQRIIEHWEDACKPIHDFFS